MRNQPPEGAPIPAQFLRELRENLGWSMEVMAKACGYRTASGYQAYESADKHPGYLSGSFVRRLAAGLREAGIQEPTEAQLFLVLSGSVPVDVMELVKSGALQTDIDLKTLRPIEQVIGKEDIPVYASANCGDGMLIQPDIIEWVKRPQPLVGIERGWAVYLIGDSMSPAYNQGDMVLVNGSRPIRRGEDALLVTAPLPGPDDVRAIVKVIVGWNDTVWHVRQYNPEKHFDLPRSEWLIAYPIVGKFRE